MPCDTGFLLPGLGPYPSLPPDSGPGSPGVPAQLLECQPGRAWLGPSPGTELVSPAAVPDTSTPRPGSSVSGSSRGAQAACVSGTGVWQGLSRGFDNDPDVVSALRRDCLAGPWESACDSERVARGFETVDTSSTGHVFSGHCVSEAKRGARAMGVSRLHSAPGWSCVKSREKNNPFRDYSHSYMVGTATRHQHLWPGNPLCPQVCTRGRGRELQPAGLQQTQRSKSYK